MSSFFSTSHRVGNNLMLRTAMMAATSRHPTPTIRQAKFGEPYISSSRSFSPHNLCSTVIIPFLQKRNLRLRFLNVIKSHSWQVAEPEFQAKCLALGSLRFISARLCLDQWFSKCGPQINSSITAWELVRNTHHWPTPHLPNKERWG